MRLRRQLLLVSLLALALPWAGCEYIREMENTLRQGQAAALHATASAVAARLASDPATQQLIEELNRPRLSPASAAELDVTSEAKPLYAHPLNNAPVLDGYNDEWRSLGLQPQPLGSRGDLSAQAVAARYGDHLYLLLRVEDPLPTYYSPQNAANQHDHIRLRLQGPGLFASEFQLYTAAPGTVTVVRQPGEREHRVQGVWQERADGYHVELRMPLNWTRDQLGVVVVDASPSGRTSVGNVNGSAAPPLVTRDEALDTALAVFVDSSVHASPVVLRLASRERWVIGRAGDYRSAATTQTGSDHLLTRLYRLALGEQQFPPAPMPEGHGRFDEHDLPPSKPSPADSRASASWYEHDGQQLARVTVPVMGDNGQLLATVVADQTTDTLEAMTDSAFSRLVSYSLLAFASAGLGLLAYASWLSWRIRRLSKATELAVDSNGRISGGFTASRSRDELGDLSRRYAELIQRLKHYNSYLETLASKLSHELRTPLAVIRSSLDNLEHENLSSAAQAYSNRARDGAERLSHILTAMSAASRVEQSIESADLETVDLHAMLKDLTAAYADVYPHVQWQLDAEDGDFQLIAAPDLLVQMLDKLADNAADFCPANQTIALGLQSDGRWVTITMSNPGPLLPAKMTSGLFDSLVSVREATPKRPDDRGQHLGLGLYIVRLIAEFHRGSASASNLPDGSGVVFSVRLPKAGPRA